MLRNALISFTVIATLIISVLSFGFFSSPVLAEDPLSEACKGSAGASSVCQSSSKDPVTGNDGVLVGATKLLTTAVGAASVIMIIVGGFRYVTSAGDSNTTKAAKDTILYAVIGLVIALVARALVLFVLREF